MAASVFIILSTSSTGLAQSVVLPLEAETLSLAAPMKIINAPSASNGQYIASTTADSGEATATFSVPVSGNYVVWVRVLATSSTRDTVDVAIDGDPELPYDAAYGAWSTSWRWERLSVRVNGNPAVHADRWTTLAPGSHTFRFVTVDPGVSLDRIILTNDPAFTPGSTVPTSPTPANTAPHVSAGPDTSVVLPAAAQLIGSVSDDGLPSGTLTRTWSVVSGPGTVTFGSPSAMSTTASFSIAGTYLLRLTGSDGVLSATDSVSVTATAAGAYYVSPTGSPSGDGSLTKPWDLQTALDHPAAVKPGHTVFLRAGVYRYTKTVQPDVMSGDGLFTSRLTGTVSLPIKVMPYPGAVVTIDGAIPQFVVKNHTILKILGAYTWFVGLQIRNSDPQGRDLQTPPPCAAPFSPPFSCGESNRGDRRGGGIDIYGPGVKLINSVVWDTGAGPGLWSQAINAEAYGNVIFNNGWDASDDNFGAPSITAGRLAGHGLYTQNDVGVKRLRDNIIFNNFGDGFHGSGTGSSVISNFVLDGNIHINDRFLFTGPPVTNITLTNNHVYRNAIEIGGNHTGNVNITVNGNTIVNPTGIGLDAKFLSDLRFDNNKVSAPVMVALNYPQTVNVANYKLNSNTYYSGASSTSLPWGFSVKPWGQISLTYGFSVWKLFSSTFDAFSQYLSQPSSPTVTVRQNAYDAARAHVVIYNWKHATSVSIPGASLGLAIGDQYELRSASNYFGDITTGTFTGGNVVLPFTNRSMAQPIGYTPVLGPNPFPLVGAFVFIRR